MTLVVCISILWSNSGLMVELTRELLLFMSRYHEGRRVKIPLYTSAHSESLQISNPQHERVSFSVCFFISDFCDLRSWPP